MKTEIEKMGVLHIPEVGSITYDDADLEALPSLNLLGLDGLEDQKVAQCSEELYPLMKQIEDRFKSFSNPTLAGSRLCRRDSFLCRGRPFHKILYYIIYYIIKLCNLIFNF